MNAPHPPGTMPADQADLRASLIASRKRFLSPSLATASIYPDDPLLLVRGEGQYVFDEAGKRYLDCTAQNLCISIGFCHPVTMAMAGEQMHRLPHTTTLFHSEHPIRYAQELVARMPAGADWVVHLVNSGAEAIDLAYMMARVHTGCFEMVALRNAYHGLQFGAAGSTSFNGNRFTTASVQGFVHAIHPDQYKGVFGAGVTPYLDELKRTIAASTSGKIAGMIIEPIQGSGGVVPMPQGYMQGAFEIVRAAGGLCISDEVQTAFGRLGSHYWGFEAHGVMPDMIVLGKGIGNGFPIAAVVCRRDIAESFARAKFFNTYACNPMASAAARSVLKVVDDEGLKAHAQRCGDHLLTGLNRLKEKHALIGDVRGQGLMLGIEVVRDRTTREPAVEEGTRVQHRLRASGFIMVKGSPTRNTFRINPPMCITLDDCDALLDAFDRALAAG
jgi:alanine-glyoxylate transaminase/(R)-3-amino-2-methylpropionate-pyruvate transaminase